MKEIKIINWRYNLDKLFNQILNYYLFQNFNQFINSLYELCDFLGEFKKNKII